MNVLQLVLMGLANLTFSMVCWFWLFEILLFYSIGISLMVNLLILAAIRFVISDLFHNLRNEERQALLHVSFGVKYWDSLIPTYQLTNFLLFCFPGRCRPPGAISICGDCVRQLWQSYPSKFPRSADTWKLFHMHFTFCHRICCHISLCSLTWF